MRLIHESHQFFSLNRILFPEQSSAITPEEESFLSEKGHLGDFNGKVLTNVNFKNLMEQLGFRGRQEHHEGAFLDVLHHNFYYNNKNWRPHSCAV